MFQHLWVGVNIHACNNATHYDTYIWIRRRLWLGDLMSWYDDAMLVFFWDPWYDIIAPWHIRNNCSWDAFSWVILLKVEHVNTVIHICILSPFKLLAYRPTWSDFQFISHVTHQWSPWTSLTRHYTLHWENSNVAPYLEMKSPVLEIPSTSDLLAWLLVMYS